MRNCRSTAFLVVCGLHAVYSSLDPREVGIKIPEAKGFIRADIQNEVDFETDGSVALKRSRDESRVSDSLRPSCKALRSKYNVDKKDTVFRLGGVSDADQAKRVHKCSEETLANFNNWKSAFLDFVTARGGSFEYERNIDVLLGSVSEVFKHRIMELEDPAYVSHAQIMLSSVAEIDKLWEPFHSGEKKSAQHLIKTAVELMIQFFIDLERLEIVPGKNLSDFLNKENKGKLLTSYAVNAFPKFPLSLANVYTNFNVRLSLQEGPITKEIGGLLHLLEDETWKFIEFDYLGTCLRGSQGEMITGFYRVKQQFLRVASPHKAEILAEELDDLWHHLAKRIVGPRWLRPATPTDNELIQYKLLYDMWSYVNHYHKGYLSEFLIETDRINPDEISAFEEAVGLLSSAYHVSYVRRRQLDLLLEKEIQKPGILVDNNKNRIISSLKDLDVQEYKTGYQKKYRNHSQKPENSNLLQVLNSEPTVMNSIIKTEKQVQKYIKSLEKIRLNQKPSYFELIKYFGSLSHEILENQEAEYKQLSPKAVKITGKVL